MKKVYRGFFYILGLIILAAGITLNTKTNLGVSPIISVAFTFSKILNINFGDATFIWYSVFVIVEITLHAVSGQRNKIPVDALQIVVSIVFTRFMNLFSMILPDLTTDLAGTVWSTMPGRLFVLAIAIILTGIGAAMSLNARVIPNPGDGIVQTLADAVNKPLGFMKNCVDISCVCLAIVLGLLIVGHLCGVGIGTICAMIGVGRVVAVFNHFALQPMRKLSGLEE